MLPQRWFGKVYKGRNQIETFFKRTEQNYLRVHKKQGRMGPFARRSEQNTFGTLEKNVCFQIWYSMKQFKFCEYRFKHQTSVYILFLSPSVFFSWGGGNNRMKSIKVAIN